MCMYRRSCSAGSHLPWSGISPKTVVAHDKINAVELCLPRAQMLLLLIVISIELSSYRCTREMQCSGREVVINVDCNKAWQNPCLQFVCRWESFIYIAYPKFTKFACSHTVHRTPVPYGLGVLTSGAIVSLRWGHATESHTTIITSTFHRKEDID
jgi:hypothetical protein